jgi:hypothetical protein
MHLRCLLAAAAVLAMLVGCTRTPSPGTQRHACREIPNGLVECEEVGPDTPAGR